MDSRKIFPRCGREGATGCDGVAARRHYGPHRALGWRPRLRVGHRLVAKPWRSSQQGIFHTCSAENIRKLARVPSGVCPRAKQPTVLNNLSFRRRRGGHRRRPLSRARRNLKAAGAAHGTETKTTRFGAKLCRHARAMPSCRIDGPAAVFVRDVAAEKRRPRIGA